MGPEAGRRSLAVALTSRCLGRCSYCYQPQRLPRDLDWADLRPALDRVLAAAGPAEVLVTGGEPLLAWPLLKRALEHVAAAGARERVRWTLLTDGLLLSPDILAVLGEHPVTVQVSCDGAGAAQERRRPGTAASLARLLHRLGERPPGSRPAVRVNATVTPATVPLMATTCARFLALGIETFRLAPVYAPDRPGDGDVRPALEAAFESVLRLCREHFARTGESPCEWFRRGPAPVPAPAGKAASASEAAVAGDPRPAPPAAADEPACNRANSRHEALDVDGRRHACLALAGRDRVPGGGPAPEPDLDRCHGPWGRCVDCRHHAACPRCALPGLMAGAPADPYRVPAFVCAFHRAALAARERFPVRPDPGFVVMHPEWLRRAGPLT